MQKYGTMYIRVKSIFYCLIMLLSMAMSSIFLLSCSSGSSDDERGEDTPDVPQIVDDAVIMYLPWSGNSNQTGSLYNAFMNNISEIERAIVAQKSMSGYRLAAFVSTSPTQAVLVEVVYDKGVCKRDTLMRYTSPVLNTSQGIADILGDVKRNVKADNYSLIIGGHGMGWIPVKARQTIQTRYFGGTADAYRADITMLAQALEKIGMHTRYILFDNCYMANIEVAYDLRNVTDYIIASTSEIMARGLPYERMWRYLCGNTHNYNAACQEFISFYNTYSSPYGALAVIDCEEVDAMAQLMKAINATYTMPDEETLEVQSLDGFSPPVFFDMGDYVTKLCDDATLRNSFTEQLRHLVPCAVTTSELKSMYDIGKIKVSAFSGITISDPSINSRAEAKSTTAWYKATH